MLSIKETIPLIHLQFSFYNRRLIPQTVRRLGVETPRQEEERLALRRGSAAGTLVIPTRHWCSGSSLIQDLTAHGFALIDAVSQERLVGEGRRDWERVQIVRLVFYRGPSSWRNATIDIPHVLAGVQRLVSEALWNVRVYLNPLLDEHRRLIPGYKSVHVNFDARVPLFNNVQPAYTREIGPDKERIGTEPVLVTPRTTIRLLQGILSLVPPSP